MATKKAPKVKDDVTYIAVDVEHGDVEFHSAMSDVSEDWPIVIELHTKSAAKQKRIIVNGF